MSKKYFVSVGKERFIVTLEPAADPSGSVLELSSESGVVRRFAASCCGSTALIDGRVLRSHGAGEQTNIALGTRRCTVSVRDRPFIAAPGARRGQLSRHRLLLAPLPGQVVSVLVAHGDRVQAGQRLLVIEAMKMQNPILAEHTGTVSRVHVDVGHVVQSGSKLVELDDQEP